MTYELPHDPPADERTGPSAQPRSRRPSRRLLFVYSCAIAALTIAVDVISKQLALHFLDTENRIPVLGDLFGLQLAFNTGVQTRGVMYPLWVSEGLATNLEADGAGGLGLGRDNPGRRERLLRARAEGRLVPIADFLTLTRVPPHDGAAHDDGASEYGQRQGLHPGPPAMRRIAAAADAASAVRCGGARLQTGASAGEPIRRRWTAR